MQKELQSKKIARILYLLNEMDRGAVNLAAMAQKLGVSKRTLQRDIRDIQDADIPIYDVKPGLYKFEDGFSLEKMKISDKEAALLVFMSEVAGTLGKDFAKSFNNLRRRFTQVGDDNPFYIKIQKGYDYTPTDATRIIEDAVKNKEIINITYTSNAKSGAYNDIRPLKIAWFEGFWYLLAHTNDGKLLKFRLEKISHAKELGKFFKHTADIERILKESTNIWFESQRNIDVKITVAKESAHYFKNKTYFPLQKIEKENKDGSLLISCKAAKYVEVTPTIMHWIPDLKVESPKELADIVKQQVEEYLKTI